MREYNRCIRQQDLTITDQRSADSQTVLPLALGMIKIRSSIRGRDTLGSFLRKLSAAISTKSDLQPLLRGGASEPIRVNTLFEFHSWYDIVLKKKHRLSKCTCEQSLREEGVGEAKSVTCPNTCAMPEEEDEPRTSAIILAHTESPSLVSAKSQVRSALCGHMAGHC